MYDSSVELSFVAGSPDATALTLWFLGKKDRRRLNYITRQWRDDNENINDRLQT